MVKYTLLPTMDEFGIKKIELKSTVAKNPEVIPETQSQPKPMAKRRFKFLRSKRNITIIASVLGVIVLFLIFTAIQAQAVYQDATSLYSQAKKVSQAAKLQNVVVVKDELVKTDKELNNLKKSLGRLSYMQFVPLANGYYADAIHVTNAGTYGIAAAITVVDSLIPYADVLGLKGESSFVGGSAEQRIQTAVKTMGKVVPNIDAIEKDLVKARSEVDAIDPNHYPNFWKFKTLRDQLVNVRTLTDESVKAIEEAKPLIKVLPELLGEPSLKKYLVLFQNDKELRPTGGFITYYAIFRIEHGVVNVEKSSNIYDLDDSISFHPKAPEIILKYLPKVSTLNIRDSNISPDFIESMKLFNSLYDKSSQKQKIDGIIALDTHVLVHVLDILGEVNAAGLTFNAKNDERCNCPQVVYELESQISTPVNFVKENRKALIGELLFAIMQKALSSSPKEYWGRLFQAGVKDIEEKHILFYIYNSDAQKGVEALNWAGRIRPFEGDYIHINDANLGGAKSNLYVVQKVKVEYVTDKDGNITRTVTLDYQNPQPHSDCNLERGGLCLNATLRDFIRVYNPKGSVLTESKGSEVKVETKEEFEKTVFEGFLRVNPKGRSIYTIKTQLPFKPSKGQMPLLIQKQPGTDKVQYEIYVNGKKVESFELLTDKEFSLKI